MKLYILKDNLENVFHITIKNNLSLPKNILDKIKNILSSNNKYPIKDFPFNQDSNYIEIGPKKLFKTSWSTNVIEIFQKSNIFCIQSIEYSIKYLENNVPKYDKMIYEIYNNDNDNNLKKNTIPKSYYIDDIEIFNKENNLGFDSHDLKYYKNKFKKLNRKPTNVELFDLSQSNSEHARHWFFRGNFINNNNIKFETLMDRIKSTKKNNNNGIVSFFDNASVIEGTNIDKLKVKKNQYIFENQLLHFSYKAETHNFPTSICPFPGASTGVGGRIRDTICVGRGGEILGGTAGYSVGDIDNFYKSDYNLVQNHPLQILIEASNGASDYGNKIGEPIIQGFCRSFRRNLSLKHNPYIKKRFEYLKPIMFSGGIGKILDTNILKYESKYNNMIGRVGGAAYRIGIGGGSASSRTQDKKYLNSDFDSVQRGDPEMANKVVKFIRTCCSLPENPILSIHDQGSGGMANCTRELAEPNGANVILDNLILGDNSLTTLEKWVAEYQEQVSFLFDMKNLDLLKAIADRENVPFVVIGNINNTNNIKVISKNEDIIPVDLPQFDNDNKKSFYLEKDTNKYQKIQIGKLNYLNLEITSNNFEFYLKKVLNHLSVCSKSFLTNKVDRSVSGLIVQQQCIGPFQLPLANNSVVSLDFNSDIGLVSSIGEQPIKGIPNINGFHIKNMVRLTISEMLLNMIWTPIEDITKINSVANWMWASKNSKDAYLINDAVDELVTIINYLGFSINGGKDSMSMSVDNITETIKSPNTLVLSGYANCISFNHIILPNLKDFNSTLLYINLGNEYNLGGTIFEDVYDNNIKLINKKIKKICNLSSILKLKNLFILIQKYIKEKRILSGHDVSDGGLITTLIEMSISSNIGIDINYNNSKIDCYDFYFNENPGIVIEVKRNQLDYILNNLLFNGIICKVLGTTVKTNKININFNNNILIDKNINEIRYEWEKKSYELEKKQANPECITQEIKNCYNRIIPKFHIPTEMIDKIYYPFIQFNNKPKVAIFNEEGSNGESEMAYCFKTVGFDVYNININDLLENKFNLNQFRGIAFVGGFSFSDVLGAGYGWYFSITNNKQIKKQFDDFFNREDTFSLGICNGCQLMSLLGWIPEGISLENNISNRFESRYSIVKVEDNNSIMLQNMSELEFGIWTAHAQGRIVCDNKDDYLFPIKYLDNQSKITEKYPFNPNGSKEGRCAIVSENGRHLAMMPHPERCVLKNQLPWIPDDIKLVKYTPWILMFRNAYEWCLN